jgi:hypothetical protein
MLSCGHLCRGAQGDDGVPERRRKIARVAPSDPHGAGDGHGAVAGDVTAARRGMDGGTWCRLVCVCVCVWYMVSCTCLNLHDHRLHCHYLAVCTLLHQRVNLF